MSDQAPRPVTSALRALIRCVGTTAVLLARRRIHLPARHVGRSGCASRTAPGPGLPGDRRRWRRRRDPCVLLVAFRLRAVRGWGHTLFRWESVLNTPLFVGSPASPPSCGWPTTSAAPTAGSTSGTGRSGPRPTPAPCGGCSRWCCVPGSIHYRVLPGLRRDDVLAEPQLLDAARRPAPRPGGGWWRQHDPRPDLLVVGAGPTGLGLALQAHDHGARVRIVERRPEAFRPSRALIVHPADAGGAASARRRRRAAGAGRHRPERRLHLGSRVVAFDWTGSPCRTPPSRT